MSKKEDLKDVRYIESDQQELREVIVQRDDGKDYKFMGRLLVDEQWEPDVEHKTEYWCGIIQVYYTEYSAGRSKEKGYILVTRQHQGVVEPNHVAVTEAGLVKNGIGMVISLILAKFKDCNAISCWVRRAIDELKASDHKGDGGEYEELKEYTNEEE